MSKYDSDKLPLVVTAEEMAAMDRRTIEEVGIPGMVLMENAGREIVRAITDYLGSVADRKIVILCGKGNNGGDGYVIARYLHKMGACVQVYLLGNRSDVKGDAKSNLEILAKIGVDVIEIDDADDLDLRETDLLVDAMLGTGVTGPVRGLFAEIIPKVNESTAPVVAVDLPTGMQTDTGAVEGVSVEADVTVTMAFKKRGLFFSPGRDISGEVVVADIGIPSQIARDSGVRCFELTRSFIRDLVPQRPVNAYKNSLGQIFVLAGSAGMTGAASLTSEACMRIGAGLAVLGIPESLNPILENKLTEVMTLPLPETEQQSLSFSKPERLAERLDWADVVAAGPGLTTHEESKKLIKWLLQKFDGPLVLDADALNSISDDPEILGKSKQEKVLTPHPGELARLTGKKIGEITGDPIESAKAAAKALNSIVVLKGGPTVIAAPEGDAFINSTGNPGMATGGMGDVLTGIIAGLIGQNLSPLHAALAGVYLHGLAGDDAAERIGQAGMLATDVLHALPSALKSFENA